MTTNDTNYPLGLEITTDNGSNAPPMDAAATAPTLPSPGQPETPDDWSLIGVLSAEMRTGSSADGVRELQSLLGVEADGVYGPKTDRALKMSFVATTYACAQTSESTTAIPAAITTAQAILESSYGEAIPIDVNTRTYSYNVFGIKAVPPQPSVCIWTREDSNGCSEKVLAHFAAYHNFQESLDAHAAFLTSNPRYKSLFSSPDPNVWAHGLQIAGYATDPDYANKLIAIIRQWKLT